MRCPVCTSGTCRGRCASVCGSAHAHTTRLRRARRCSRGFRHALHPADADSRLAHLEARLQALESTSLDPWEDIPSDSSRLRKTFHSDVVKYYHGSEDAVAQCMVTGSVATGKTGVVAAHLWPFASSGIGLERFGLTKVDKHSPRNGLLLLKVVETAFNQKRVAFFFNDVSKVFEFIVLDQLLDNNTIGSDVTCVDEEGDSLSVPRPATFSDFHGRALQLPPAASTYGAFPLRRLLAWHFAQSLNKAMELGWRSVEQLAAYWPLTGDDHVRAWLRGGSPSASWHGAVQTGLVALRAVRRNSEQGETESETDGSSSSAPAGSSQI